MDEVVVEIIHDDGTTEKIEQDSCCGCALEDMCSRAPGFTCQGFHLDDS
jgi:hypothetical protein